MNTVAEARKLPRARRNPAARFHAWMALASAIILASAFVGCRVDSIHAHAGRSALALLLVLAMLAPLPVYWHEKRRINLRESTLVIAWEALLAVLLPYTVYVAGRSGMPLRDALFGRIDQALGLSVSAVQAWAQHHWLGAVCTWTYQLLIPFLAFAAVASALTGKVKYAREFLIANVAAFAIGMPMFALLPAVGPWYVYHTAPNPGQLICQTELLALRMSGPITDASQLAALVCFPSFHVIWAVLCCASLWGFRYLRIPAALLSCLIIASTVTTGWHYFTDIGGGLLVAGISLAIAKWCTRALDKLESVSETRDKAEVEVA